MGVQTVTVGNLSRNRRSSARNAWLSSTGRGLSIMESPLAVRKMGVRCAASDDVCMSAITDMATTVWRQPLPGYRADTRDRSGKYLRWPRLARDFHVIAGRRMRGDAGVPAEADFIT